MKILHTSDWHLGRTLYGRRRYEEFEAFLAWLAETIEANHIEALLVAGDIFDTSAPSNRAQALYYRFLCRVAGGPCRHVVVIGGNHDSPSFLEAPRDLLRALDVHVIGRCAEDLEDEVLVLENPQSEPELIVCAVPYLRDRDIRVAEAGESVEDKARKLQDGIRSHYVRVAALAEEKRRTLGADIPILGMGHLFTAGGQTQDGDGVRELYVGALAHVHAETFPASFDYLALGHLHVPQKVGGSETRRYSGSPLPMGFGEARQQKSLCHLSVQVEPPEAAEAGGRVLSVDLIKVPVFQALERISGDWEAISQRLAALAQSHSAVWVEVIYEGEAVMGQLRESVDALVADTAIEVLRIKNTRMVDRVLAQTQENACLDDLDEKDVFAQCLNAHEVPEAQRPALWAAYQETLNALHEDSRAEQDAHS